MPGLTLDEMVSRHGPLSAARTIHFLRQLCAALREAHGMNLVHRDIKPANVMTCERGGIFDVVKLLDFGLVRGGGPQADTMPEEGFVAGTPGYMAPEQATTRPIDGRTDIYSLGAVAYFLLTGQHPFARESVIRSYEPLVRNTSRRPTARPTSVCAVGGMATGYTNIWTNVTAADHAATHATRQMILGVTEPLTASRLSVQRLGL